MPTWANMPGMVAVPIRPSTPATAPKRPVGSQLVLVGGFLALPPAEQAGAGELLDADGQAHVALAGLDGHDRGAQRGGTGGARVRHVVHGDAGLADLLLQLLAERSGPTRLPAARMPMSPMVTPASASAAMAASAPRSMTSLSGCLPNFVMLMPRMQMSSLIARALRR